MGSEEEKKKRIHAQMKKKVRIKKECKRNNTQNAEQQTEHTYKYYQSCRADLYKTCIQYFVGKPHKEHDHDAMKNESHASGYF